MKTTNKSQLAKDLSRALYICRLQDDLADLVDDATIQDERTDNYIRNAIRDSYLKATVLLGCFLSESKPIRDAVGSAEAIQEVNDERLP